MSNFIWCSNQSDDKINLETVDFVFVGAVVPPDEANQYPGYSAAGNLWQLRFIAALQEYGFRCTEIVSARPVPSFPRMRRVWFSSSEAKVPGGLIISYLPFLNLGPLKTLVLGLTNFVGLLRWGWRHRHQKNKAVITYNINAPHGLSTLLAARIVRAKAFAIIADLPVPGHGIIPSSVLRFVDFLVQVISIRWFDGLIVLTRVMSQDFAPKVPSLNMEGAVDGLLMESIDDSQPEGTRHFTLMYAGALNEFDGVLLLLDAFSRLEGDLYRLIIAGKGPLQARVEHQALEDPRISYMGFIPHQQVLQLYQHADILINPRPSHPLSTRYVFPSKLVEYLATGKLVITTATADVVQEYGNFVIILLDETPTGLAKLVSQVATMPQAERQAMGQDAKRYMLEHKTWLAQGRRIAVFLREQIDDK